MHTLFHQLFRTVYPHRDLNEVKREYGMPETLQLTVRLKDGKWFVVTSPQLPGLVTQASDQQELVEMVNDAVLTYFDVPKREADIVYNRFNVGDQVIEYQAELRTQAV